MPKYPCKKQGCPNLIDRPGYCENHKKVERDRSKKTEPFYGTYAWKQARKYKIKKDPLCEKCLHIGKTVKAQMVDHIKPIKEGGAKLDQNNLQSLCWACHGTKTHGSPTSF